MTTGPGDTLGFSLASYCTSISAHILRQFKLIYTKNSRLVDHLFDSFTVLVLLNASKKKQHNTQQGRNSKGLRQLLLNNPLCPKQRLR